MTAAFEHHGSALAAQRRLAQVDRGRAQRELQEAQGARTAADAAVARANRYLRQAQGARRAARAEAERTQEAARPTRPSSTGYGRRFGT